MEQMKQGEVLPCILLRNSMMTSLFVQHFIFFKLLLLNKFGARACPTEARWSIGCPGLWGTLRTHSGILCMTWLFCTFSHKPLSPQKSESDDESHGPEEEDGSLHPPEQRSTPESRCFWFISVINRRGNATWGHVNRMCMWMVHTFLISFKMWSVCISITTSLIRTDSSMICNCSFVDFFYIIYIHTSIFQHCFPHLCHRF